MSWDVMIFNMPGVTEIEADLPDEAVLPLGSRNDVIRAISTAFPHADVADPSWIVLDGEGYSIELGVDEAEVIESLMLFVRGSAAAIDAIERLCVVGGWRAWDTSVGRFIDFASPERDIGLRRWQEYRDSTLGGCGRT